MTDIDVGKYNFDEERYKSLIEELYAANPNGVILPPEYADFVQNNLLRLFIRLARYKFVARIIKPSDSVLEIGSGSGLGAMFLAQHSKSVVGVELKRTEFEEARRVNKRDNLEFRCCDLFEMPDGEFDVVIALDVIEHMDVVKGHRLIEAMTKNLSASGMLIVGTPSIYSYPFQSDLSQASHVHCYDQVELLELIDHYCERTIPFSMNDEMLHTGHHKLAWY